MKLYFLNRKGKERLVSECETVQEVYSKIKDQSKKSGLKSMYIRFWEENGRIRIDYGSWAEFFFVEGITIEEWLKDLDGVG